MKPTALLLAGGKSRRFGQDKARAVVNGRTMIEHVYEVVAQVAGPVLVSVADEKTRYPLPETVRYFVDRHANIGALAGLHAGLVAAQTPWLLAVACDMPFLTVEALRKLLEARTEDAEAVVAVSPGGQRHPLCACYRRSVLAQVEAQIENKSYALHALLDQLRTVEVALPAEVVRNINRPSDLANRAEPPG